MVFESYVVDLLNKFAGQYLENLDTSQLRLGIWGGTCSWSFIALQVLCTLISIQTFDNHIF